jgi:cellulose synthase/poly-beta-1,6-N-acetylglucosamine synthase-like glycosyltransferase
MVPVLNEAAAVGNCLASVLASRYPAARMEVIVADGMSTDGTRAVVRDWTRRDARVRMIDNPGRTTPRALNRAIAASRGDILLRVDAHSRLARDYIDLLVEFLEANPGAWGAGGRMRTVPARAGIWGEAVAAALSHRFGVGNSRFRTATSGEPSQVDTVFNCAWRREVFSRVGYFHEDLARSQDMEFSTRLIRAGGTLWLVPRAETTYYARTAPGAYLAHNWTNGVWSVLPLAYCGALPVRPRHLAPLAFVVALLGSGIAACLWPQLRPAPLAVAVPYGLANLAASWSTAWRARRWRLAALLPLAFAGLHVSYGAGSLWGALRLSLLAASARLRNPAHAARPVSGQQL